MADWSGLPKDLLVLIAKRLDTSDDLSRFRSVCSTWRSSVAPKRRRFSGCVPMLPDDNTNISTDSCGLPLSKCTVFLVQSPQRATSWLIKIEEDTHNQKRLIYPLNRRRLDFRKVLDVRNLSICEIGHGYVLNYVHCHQSSKVALMHIGNSKSDSDGFVLLTVHVSGELAMFKSGHEKWTILQHMQSPFDDVIVYKGRFYAVDNTGTTVIVDCSGCSVNLVESPVFGGGKKYLVECKGDLLLVDMSRRIDAAIFGPYMDWLQPPVYKLDEERKEWTKMTDLKDDLLFLGEDCVFSVSANKLGVSRGNCILFVDNVYGSSEDEADDDAHRRVGVFDLETGRIELLGNYPELSKLFWPPPGWTFSSIVEHDRKCEANDGHHGRQQAVGKVAA
ncbi:F-box protein SKIP23-like [Mangifera indica]|uniref:F-box protein SKIP23-like n=1 Tax=Mangifera indica TaxID=29780 RepID=UPI001CFBDB4A|nr:F-box protein SKIP23-like [Mangifera indica]